MRQLVNVDLIKEHIKTNNLTKREFCKQCNISVSTLYKILQGKTNFDLVFIFRIAKSMKVEVKDLFNP